MNTQVQNAAAVAATASTAVMAARVRFEDLKRRADQRGSVSAELEAEFNSAQEALWAALSARDRADEEFEALYYEALKRDVECVKRSYSGTRLYGALRRSGVDVAAARNYGLC